jgi:hypothetical protein
MVKTPLQLDFGRDRLTFMITEGEVREMVPTSVFPDWKMNIHMLKGASWQESMDKWFPHPPIARDIKKGVFPVVRNALITCNEQLGNVITKKTEKLFFDKCTLIARDNRTAYTPLSGLLLGIVEEIYFNRCIFGGVTRLLNFRNAKYLFFKSCNVQVLSVETMLHCELIVFYKCRFSYATKLSLQELSSCTNVKVIVRECT